MATCHNCCCRNLRWFYPFENGVINLNAFAVEGRVIYEVWLWKYFWNEVRLGRAGLNPVALFSSDDRFIPSPIDSRYVN